MGDVFRGYTEGPLRFRPTYRYDYGTDIYDTSEKMRIPAWTGEEIQLFTSFPTDICLDRILFRGPQLSLSCYSRGELRGSDHKPGSCAFPFYILLFAEIIIPL